MTRLALTALLCLSACGGPPPEYLSVCVKSHVAMQPIFFPSANGGTRMQMMPRTVCDEREQHRNPEYDEWLSRTGGAPITPAQP